MSSANVVIQISDLHFGTEVPEVVSALSVFVREQSPALLIVSGDITQRARTRQFEAARRFVAQLSAAQVLVVPGNHDIPIFNLVARFRRPYGHFARAFGSELEPEFESDRLLVLGVKTTRRMRHTDGEVSEQQIERVAQRLAAARPEQLRIVVTHQPLHVTRPRDEKNLLHGWEPAVRRWATAGADVLMGGHIHLPYVRPVSERISDLARAVWVVQAGTAVSRRVRWGAPNSVNLVRYPFDASGGYCVERWDFAAASGKFERVEVHQLTLDRAEAGGSVTAPHRAAR